MSMAFSAFIRALLPTWCVACGERGNYLCPTCFEKIEYLPNPNVQLSAAENLASAQAVGSFSPPLSTLIATHKYQSVIGIGEYLGTLLYTSLTFPTVDCISSVPLHITRQRERGFNQSEVIARTLAQLLRKPYVPLLTRTRSTERQATIQDPTQRKHNVLQAFTPLYRNLPSLSVLLIDDVVTTGETLASCAAALQSTTTTTVHAVGVAHGSATS